MAIQVGGYTVIDNSRNLANVGGLKTVNGTSLVGSGNISAGASTSNGAVGTYAVAGKTGTGGTTWGNTFSGSNLKLNNSGTPMDTYQSYQASSSSISGTWRLMCGRANGDNGDSFYPALWVRIS